MKQNSFLTIVENLLIFLDRGWVIALRLSLNAQFGANFGCSSRKIRYEKPGAEVDLSPFAPQQNFSTLQN